MSCFGHSKVSPSNESNESNATKQNGSIDVLPYIQLWSF